MNDALTPHGPGFRFIDTVRMVEPGKTLRAAKWLDPELSFFADHFPGEPLMPGVLLVESAAQAAGVLWGSVHGGAPRRYALAKVVQFKMQKPVPPGRMLQIEVTLEKDFGALAQFEATLSVADDVIAVGKIVLSDSTG
jgi:3-hydroxyacyl-[acyl-carrier-protein] dehydratase